MCEKKKKKQTSISNSRNKEHLPISFFNYPILNMPVFIASAPLLVIKAIILLFLCWKILELFILRLICSHIGQWWKRQEKFNASVLKMNTSDVHFLNSSNLCYILKLIYWLKFLLKLWGGCSLLIILFIFPRL